MSAIFEASHGEVSYSKSSSSIEIASIWTYGQSIGNFFDKGIDVYLVQNLRIFIRWFTHILR